MEDTNVYGPEDTNSEAELTETASGEGEIGGEQGAQS